MLVYTPPEPLDSVPVVDLGAGFNGAKPRAGIAREIREACRNIGFFYVIGHGVPEHLVTDQFAWARRFFALPEAEKLAIHMRNSASKAGYEPLCGQQLDSQDAADEAAPPDLKESFYWVLDLPDDHPLARRRLRSMGHNQVPASLPGFREQMLAYQGALKRLADELLSLIALSLDLDADWFAGHFDWPTMAVRLLRYPPQPETHAYNQIGAGAHTDWGAVTLLAQDDTGGLEVRNASGRWVAAPPVPGAFVVNLGDLMARWTNGIYASNMHRVRNAAGGRDRYSIPFFYSPRHDAVIEPAPSCIGPDQPPRFDVCTTAAHMDEMFRRSYGYLPGA